MVYFYYQLLSARVKILRRNAVTYQQRKKQVWSYLGKNVEIKIDRPIGYIHKKENYTLKYKINYGYIPDVIGGDGEELDVYVLGINKPLERFNGRIIGIVNRENDVEDKLVAAPEGMIFNQARIAEQVYFQEKYYKTSIDALYQKSCGAVVYRSYRGINEYLLLLQKKSHTWSFPKGHMEAYESERQTAIREVKEETGYKVNLARSFRHEIKYTVGGLVQKSVVLYLAKVRGTPSIQKSEISSYKWVNAEDAKKLLFGNYHSIIDSAEKYIAENSRTARHLR